MVQRYRKPSRLGQIDSVGAFTYATVPLSGLVSYYNLNETTGTVVDDAYGTNNGTASNITRTAGKIANAASFNGSSSQIVCGKTGIPASGDMSVACRLYPKRNGGGWQDIVTYRDGTNLRRLLYQHGDDGSISLHGANQNRTALIPTLNQWVHITATVQSGTLKIYFNGAVAYSTGGFTYYGGTEPTQLTLGSASGAEYLLGLIDEVGIWNRALTQDEITALYNGGTGITL